MDGRRFKIGDSVLCIDEGVAPEPFLSPLTFGKTYKVIESGNWDDGREVVWLEDMEGFNFNVELFKLAADAEEDVNFWDSVAE